MSGGGGPTGLGRIARARGAEAERGSITLLTIALGVIAAALVLVVATATAVHLERKRLLHLADGAAADAATAIELAEYYAVDSTDTEVPLTDLTVRDAVDAHLASAPAATRLRELHVVEPTGSPDGTSAEVSLAAVARPTFVPWVLVPWSEGILLEVTVHARAS